MEELWFRWRGELKAVCVLAFLAIVAVSVLVFKQSGPMTPETGLIVRFGSYANEVGNQPIVVVRTDHGQLEEVKASATLLNRCAAGGQIRLLRRAHNLAVAPEGCL